MSIADLSAVIPGRAKREPGTQVFKLDIAPSPLGSGSPLRFGRNDGALCSDVGGAGDA